MIKKNVYVSFDEKDRPSCEAVAAWNKNPQLAFFFIETSAAEQNCGFAVQIKNSILSKLAQASAVLVLAGEGANDTSPDCLEIGAINWQSFAIAKSLERRLPIVCAKLDEDYSAPVALRNADVIWAGAFTLDAVMHALAKLA